MMGGTIEARHVVSRKRIEEFSGLSVIEKAS